MKKNLFIIMFCLAIVLPNIVYYVFQDHFDTENYENRAYAEMPAFTFENIEIALYSGIAVFVMTKIMDLFLEGGNYAKAMFIISNKSEEISEFILNEIGRGATLLDGKGAYTKEDKNILMCVANKKEIPKLKERINEIDDKCFIIITTVTEAIGQGWKNN